MWNDLHIVSGEYHFHVVAKWGIEKWFRIPEAVYRELLAFRTDSPFVFAACMDQLRRFHAHNPNWLRSIGDEFSPVNFGRWIYSRVKDWSATNPKGKAFVHVFRKTTLQHAPG